MISIILPIRDEPNIVNFLCNLHKIMQEIGQNYEILVVIGDREKLHPYIPYSLSQKVITSFGDSLERAILVGFSHAVGDKVIVLDSDESHPVKDMSNIIRELDKNDLVVGSRFLKESIFSSNFYRKFVTFGFMKLSRLKGSTLSDPMSGFFGIRRSVLGIMKFKPIKWKICLEIELYYHKSGRDLKISEIPIEFSDRKIGNPKSNYKIAFALAKDLMSYRWN